MMIFHDHHHVMQLEEKVFNIEIMFFVVSFVNSVIIVFKVMFYFRLHAFCLNDFDEYIKNIYIYVII